ncbi:Ankyrin repeat-containing protein C6C3.08, partial [Bienertia sinuspersici]
KYEDLLYKTPDQGNSIIHIAVRYGRWEFIDKPFSLYPHLLQQKNGNTPFHEAAALASNETVKHLISCLQNRDNLSSSTTTNDAAAGTYLTEIVRCVNLPAAEELFPHVVDHHWEFLVLKTFIHKETPRHLYVRFCDRMSFFFNFTPPFHLLAKSYYTFWLS